MKYIYLFIYWKWNIFKKPLPHHKLFLLISRGVSQSLINCSWFCSLLLWGTAATCFLCMVLDRTSPPASAPFPLLEGRSFNSCTHNLFCPGYLHGPGNQAHPCKSQSCQLASPVALIIQITDLHLWTLLDSFHHIKLQFYYTWEPVSLTGPSFSFFQASFPHL